jgi:hypothetical protein
MMRVPAGVTVREKAGIEAQRRENSPAYIGIV